MEIKEIKNQIRNDFTWIGECEHCGHTHKYTSGYDDNNYHDNVIPNMKCKVCHKSSNDK